MINNFSERNPLDPTQMVSLRHWDDPSNNPELLDMDSETVVNCGWGRLIFGQTFTDPQHLVDTILNEQPGRRDLALYLRNPQVVVSLAPQDLFIDPSYTYRLVLNEKMAWKEPEGWRIRSGRLQDIEDIRRLYKSRHMVAPTRSFLYSLSQQKEIELLVAEDMNTQKVVGVITGVDHVRAFNDPDNGSSLWALAVDPQSSYPGIGEGLSRALAARFYQRGRAFMDLSVLHDNMQAIGLYEKLGFVRVPVYCVKKKNSINEELFIGPDLSTDLNIYARVIVREALRRGISVEVLDTESSYFRLSLGGRGIICRESLSELTTAIAMSRCDDKSLTLRILSQGGINVPAQVNADDLDKVSDFLKHYKSVVVKPARGEQGQGVRIDLSTMEEIKEAIEAARHFSEHVIVEQMAQGEDLRIVVINHQVVAAATRRPPLIIGDGQNSIRTLIEKQSRRRQMATGGESHIPIDRETIRCLESQGYELDQVLETGKQLRVRKNANLHTGGTIHDMTECLHPVLKEAAERASQLLDIPVVGLDFIVPGADQPEYVIIEANERPGLANHEPQPTVERFVDLLFPQTRADLRQH